MTRGEIWAWFAGMAIVYDGCSEDFGWQADDLMAEYDKRFAADGDEKRQEGA